MALGRNNNDGKPDPFENEGEGESTQDGMIPTHGMPIAQMANLKRIDREDTRQRIVAGILGATDIDAVFAMWEDKEAENKVDRPMRIDDVAFDESTYNNSIGWYALVFAHEISTGEEWQFSIGAENVVTQLIALANLNSLPVDVVIKKSERPTREGYYPLHLERIRGKATATSAS